MIITIKVPKTKLKSKLKTLILEEIKSIENQNEIHNFIDVFISVARIYNWTWYTGITKPKVQNLIENFIMDLSKPIVKHYRKKSKLPKYLPIRFISSGRITLYISYIDETESDIIIEISPTIEP